MNTEDLAQSDGDTEMLVLMPEDVAGQNLGDGDDMDSLRNR